ncbi:hypothetical protein B0H14DRAFT_2679891 [Mycena olivaceomarginata]|nr:hypothetical protein B0H14DRAFT_2679891 [Mycena olivaceomarginata]
MATRPYKPYPWPWGQPSILTTSAEEERRQANFWLDADLGEDEDDGSEVEYVPSSSDDSVSNDSDDSEETSNSASDQDISESELAQLHANAAETTFPSSPTPSTKEIEAQEELSRQIADLVKAEQDAAAAYNPDEVVALITEFYELLVTMGHWPEGSLRYPPHDPPVNETLAVQLGYAPATISLMHRLPYVASKFNDADRYAIVARTRLADYTRDKSLKEGRCPYPYQYIDGCPDIDPWLLPFTLPHRDGWNVMLDTRLGCVRAYSTEGSPSQNTVEWRRHGEISDKDEATWTEYRRAPLVPAARYFSELIYAYRSLERLPIIAPDISDPKEERHPSYAGWLGDSQQAEQQTLLKLYRDCGWPDDWRRAEFVEKWEIEKEEIGDRAREAMVREGRKRH